MDKSTKIALMCAAGVVVVIIVISIVSRISMSWTGSTPDTIDKASRILRAASQWSVTAEQDKNPVLALMHNTTAKTYVNALREMLPDAEIANALKVDAKDMLQKIEKMEQKIHRKIAAVAPALIPNGQFTGRTGWVP